MDFRYQLTLDDELLVRSIEKLIDKTTRDIIFSDIEYNKFLQLCLFIERSYDAVAENSEFIVIQGGEISLSLNLAITDVGYIRRNSLPCKLVD